MPRLLKWVTLNLSSLKKNSVEHISIIAFYVYKTLISIVFINYIVFNQVNDFKLGNKNIRQTPVSIPY